MREEIGLGRFGDRRLEKGGRRCTRRWCEGPVRVFDALLGSRAREVQFTRFLRNKKVGVAEMASHAAARTADRVGGREVIVVQDTSELFLGGRRAKANGYGPVGKGGGVRGLLLHAALAIDAGNDALLGLVDAQVGIATRAR